MQLPFIPAVVLSLVYIKKVRPLMRIMYLVVTASLSSSVQEYPSYWYRLNRAIAVSIFARRRRKNPLVMAVPRYILVRMMSIKPSLVLSWVMIYM